MINVCNPTSEPLQISVRSSLPDPINYVTEWLNVQLGVVDPPARRTFLCVILLHLQENSTTNFLRDSVCDLFPCVDRVTGLRFLMSQAHQERTKFKLLHEGWQSGFKVSFMRTFNSRPTAFESAHSHRITRAEILCTDIQYIANSIKRENA